MNVITKKRSVKGQLTDKWLISVDVWKTMFIVMDRLVGPLTTLLTTCYLTLILAYKNVILFWNGFVGLYSYIIWLVQNWSRTGEKVHFDENQDLTGKTIVLLGGTRGMGFHILKHLYKRGATIYMLDYQETAAKETIRIVENEKGSKNTPEITFLHCDLQSLANVRIAAQKLASMTQKIDTLYLNAGIASPLYRKFTVDQIEMTLQVNCYGPLLFLSSVLHLLRNTRGTVVFTGSMSHLTVLWPDVSDTRGNIGHYDPWRAYSISKFIVAMIFKFLSEVDKKVTYIIADPKVVNTVLGAGFLDIIFGPALEKFPRFRQLSIDVNTKCGQSAEEAVEGFVALGYAEEAKNYSGCYFSNYKLFAHHYLLLNKDKQAQYVMNATLLLFKFQRNPFSLPDNFKIQNYGHKAVQYRSDMYFYFCSVMFVGFSAIIGYFMYL